MGQKTLPVGTIKGVIDKTGMTVEAFIKLLYEATMRYERYTVIIEPDEEEPHRYNIHVPALPGCLTYGESIDDALSNAVEAIQGYVAVGVADGDPVPIEHQPSIAATIAVPLIDIPDGVESAALGASRR